jgi:hypothetical protein
VVLVHVPVWVCGGGGGAPSGRGKSMVRLIVIITVNQGWSMPPAALQHTSTFTKGSQPGSVAQGSDVTWGRPLSPGYSPDPRKGPH